MSLSIDINPEDVNKMVSEAILNSAIGENVKKQIDTYIKELNYSHSSPIKDVIQGTVSCMIRETIESEYKEQLREILKQALDERITIDLMSGIVDSAMEAIRRRY